MQSYLMNSNWAEENLQTIRTLMERSAVYRRAIAPVTLFAGAVGILAAGIGLGFELESPLGFGLVWLIAAVVAIAGAFFIVRRQAVKAGEQFWSPPTRRVAQTLLPPLTAGLFVGFAFTYAKISFALPFLWALFYGCALHSAGFFMPRGVRLFGWVYILGTIAIVIGIIIIKPPGFSAHWMMGFLFGILHLGYGTYLYLTERGKNAA
jgi:uncharacterized membrane protein HdeD (DUF308 family)